MFQRRKMIYPGLAFGYNRITKDPGSASTVRFIDVFNMMRA